jgi:TatD DNase family protein
MAYKNDIDEVIKRAEKAGVSAAMIVGFNLKSSQAAIKMAQAHKGFFASVGVHPHDVNQCSQLVIDQLKDIVKHPKVRAWGETGLDFNRMFSPQKDQEKWFQKQLETAYELNLPVIFHERDSRGRFLEILRSNLSLNLKGVVHCFSGSKAELHKYLDLGYYIGITGILTIEARGAELRKQAVLIPRDRLLIETDAPYLTPEPDRKKTNRNEPAFVNSILIKLARVRGEDPEYLSMIIWDNTCRLYGIEDERNP